ncbi:hypothetical protein ALC56_03123, partial [Trachymyrmex septentrionalis]
ITANVVERFVKLCDKRASFRTTFRVIVLRCGNAFRILAEKARKRITASTRRNEERNGRWGWPLYAPRTARALRRRLGAPRRPEKILWLGICSARQDMRYGHDAVPAINGDKRANKIRPSRGNNEPCVPPGGSAPGTCAVARRERACGKDSGRQLSERSMRQSGRGSLQEVTAYLKVVHPGSKFPYKTGHSPLAMKVVNESALEQVVDNKILRD